MSFYQQTGGGYNIIRVTNTKLQLLRNA